MHRIAHGLTGDAALAARIVRFVLRRGVQVMPRWRQGIVPENWFHHHTVLTIRRVRGVPPLPERDLLVTAGPTGRPEYVAFIRALRRLHGQQAEAFILHHGERFNSRLMGVAMDCSTQAAASHLNAATNELRAIAGDEFPALTAALTRAYASLTPPETSVRTSVHGQVGRIIWRERVARMVRRLVWLLILAALVLVGWRERDRLLHWFHLIRSGSTTRLS